MLQANLYICGDQDQRPSRGRRISHTALWIPLQAFIHGKIILKSFVSVDAATGSKLKLSRRKQWFRGRLQGSDM